MTFDVAITDALGRTCEQEVSLEVEAFDCIINSESLPDGITGTPYSQTLVSTFGVGPRTFTTPDPLPTGLTLHSSGLINGTPTVVETKSFLVTVTDSLASTCTDVCTINVAGVNCGANPQNIQTASWTITPAGQAPCVTAAALTAGVCASWHIRIDDPTPPTSGPCQSGWHSIRFDTILCNPGAAYNITVTLPYASSGGVIFPPPNPHFAFLGLTVGPNNASTSGNINNDSPNPLVVTASLPAYSISAVSILIELQATPQFTSWVALDGTGNLTVTPLTHP
jgi:hypothetical protein